MIDDNLGRVQVNAEEELTILSSCTVAVREEIRNILTKAKTKTKTKTKTKANLAHLLGPIFGLVIC